MTTQTLSNYAAANGMNQTTESQGLFARVANAVNWIIEFPRRQAVIAELAELSDHELADIGLVRSDLGRVFDANFAASRSRAQIGRTSAI